MPIQFPTGNFEAYLYDCDGTLADSMPIHTWAWEQALHELGCKVDPAIFRELAGLTTEATLGIINQRYGLTLNPLDVTNRKEEFFYSRLDQVKPIEEVVAHARGLHGLYPLAVVSGGKREPVIKTLKALKILELFATVVTAEDYERGKPDPEPYLVAARRLGVPPASCLVIEDGPPGIESAKAAGMSWVLI